MKRTTEYALALLTLGAATLLNWFVFRPETYWAPSIIYLFVITILGGVLGRGPVILAAGLSALAWDFLFIPPRFTLHVDRWEDGLILLAYAAIAALTSLYTWRIRQQRQIAEDVSRQAAEARASEELYRIVFNSISHEMRSPLTTIMGSSSALYLIGDGEVVRTEDRRALLREIIRSAVRLSRLVDNFLSVSRLEAGRLKLRREELDLRAVVHDVLAALKEELSAHSVVAALPAHPVLVRGDAGLLHQSLFCVLHNASQYTPAGTTIRIWIVENPETESGETVQLHIEDNGPGAGEIDPERLFEKFFRAGRTPGGAGLGLGIARGIAELHGGRLTAEKAQSGGLRFLLSLPRGASTGT